MISGSVQIKNGKYHTVIYIRQPNGKNKPIWKTTGLDAKGNKKKALKILRERIAEYEAKEMLISSDIMFSDYLYKWLVNKEDEIDPVTFQGYEQYIKKHIIPYFEKTKIKLTELESQDIQKYINIKHANGKLNGQGGLSRRTLSLHKHVMNQALKTALTNKYITSNPCVNIKMPKDNTDKPKFDFYSEMEITNFLKDIKDEFLYPAIKMLSTYGLRRSELLGLKRENVNFFNLTFTIAATVVKVTKTVHKNKTKNKTSNRSFPMDEEIYELLKKIKEEQDYNRKICGKDYIESDYVFTWPNGALISPDYKSKKFNKLLKKYGYRHIRLHELRHTCACLLLAHESPLKEVQDWLGHADVKMTANVYGHLDISSKKKTLTTVQGALSRD